MALKFEEPHDISDIFIREDNQGSIALSDERGVNVNSEHINVRHEMIVDILRKGTSVQFMFIHLKWSLTPLQTHCQGRYLSSHAPKWV